MAASGARVPTVLQAHVEIVPYEEQICVSFPFTFIISNIGLVFFLSFSGWGETESAWYVGRCWPIVPAPDDRWWWWLWSSWWNEDWQGKPKYSEKTCPSATLSTTNLTWPDLGSNPGRRGGKPATNRLRYGTADIGLYPPILQNELSINRSY
jgi:hypothetical protein